MTSLTLSSVVLPVGADGPSAVARGGAAQLGFTSVHCSRALTRARPACTRHAAAALNTRQRPGSRESRSAGIGIGVISRGCEHRGVDGRRRVVRTGAALAGGDDANNKWPSQQRASFGGASVGRRKLTLT